MERYLEYEILSYLDLNDIVNIAPEYIQRHIRRKDYILSNIDIVAINTCNDDNRIMILELLLSNGKINSESIEHILKLSPSKMSLVRVTVDRFLKNHLNISIRFDNEQ